MKDIYLGNKRIATLSPSGIAIINKSLDRHLYRKLYAFCINETLFRNIDIHGFLFSTALQDYFISKQTICNFKEKFNPYISFNGERQLALPLAIMDTTNKMTGEQQHGLLIDNFVPEYIYSGWCGRTIK